LASDPAGSSGALFEELLGTLRSPITEFDCGTLCAPGNDGVPVCCQASSIVPFMYKAEYELLRRRSKLWGPYRPRNSEEVEMVQEARSCEFFAECKGHEHCERDNRSLACRTFPFEPYLDHDAQLAGLVWYYELKRLCPLIESSHKILPEFIRECISMWEKLFASMPDEIEYYHETSESLRRSFGQARLEIPVHTRNGIQLMPTNRR
jgi:Fe-S-cluster containining protein